MVSRQVVKTRVGMAAVRFLLVVVLGLAPGLTGCYGNFPLTKTVFKFNGSVSSKPLQTLVFWGFLFLPVYSTALVGDTCGFNLIEYWTGARVDISRGNGPDGTVYAFEPSPDGGEAVLSLSRGGAPVDSLRFVRTPDHRVEMRDASGRLVGQVIPTPQGGLSLTDADGHPVQNLSAEQIAAIRAK